MTGALVAVGETMGLFTSVAPGGHTETFRLSVGGAESNVAIGVARLGARSAWVGRVGADLAGERVLRELRAEGVEVAAVVDAGAPTGLMVKSHPIAPVTRVEYHRASSAGSRLDPGDIDPQLVEGAAVVHVTGITPALSDSAADTIERVLELAVHAGVPVSFDINHRPSLWSGRSARDCYRRIAARADVVFAGADEAALLVQGDSPAELARGLAALGPRQVLVKLGREGAVASIDGEEVSVAAIPIDPVDTVGAGDAFAAGYLAEWLAGADTATRLTTAVRAATFACLGPGDWESFPRRRDLGLLDGQDPVLR